MSFTVEEWDSVRDSLIAACSANLVILAGAGISVASGIPAASGVVQALRDEGRIGDDVVDYQAAMAKAFKDAQERGAFIRRLCEGAFANQSHQAIAMLAHEYNVGPILTTNFDHLLEQASVATDGRPTLVSTLGSPIGAVTRNSAVRILKLHGDAAYNITAHSDDEMSRQHAWLDRWSQFNLVDNSSLLAVGHSGYDQPVRDLILRWANSGVLSEVFWVLRGDPLPHLLEFRDQVLATGTSFRLLTTKDVGILLAGMASEVSGVEFRVRKSLLPEYGITTGLMYGAGEVDPVLLADTCTSEDLDFVAGRRWADLGNRIQVFTNRGETVLRATSKLAMEVAPDRTFVFALDAAANLPESVGLERSFVGWVARATSQTYERIDLERAAAALGAEPCVVIVDVSHSRHLRETTETIVALSVWLPTEAQLWVISNPTHETFEGFEQQHFNVRELLLPETTMGVLPFLRRAFDEDELALLLDAEQLGRTVDDLVRDGLAERRGHQIRVNRDRWGLEAEGRTHYRSITVDALRRIRDTREALSALTITSDIEDLLFDSARDATSYAMKLTYLQQAADELLRAAPLWAGPFGTGFFLRTLEDIAEQIELAEVVDVVQLRSLGRILSQWPPLPFPRYGKFMVVANTFPRVTQAMSRIRTLLLGDPAISPESDESAIRERMASAAASWSGGALAVAHQLWSEMDRLEPLSIAKFGEWLSWAEDFGATPRERAIPFDDFAMMLWAQGEVQSALRVWGDLSADMFEIGGVPAVIHACNFGVALWRAGATESASSLFFEASSIAARIGDEARVWRALIFLNEVASSPDIEAWALRWLKHAGASDTAGNVQERLENEARRRGENLRIRVRRVSE